MSKQRNKKIIAKNNKNYQRLDKIRHLIRYQKLNNFYFFYSKKVFQLVNCLKIKFDYNFKKKQMRKKMNQHLLKINQQEKNLELLLNQLEENIKAEILNQFKSKFNKFKQKFHECKKDLKVERQALSYYINKYELSLKQQNEEFKQDLFPLFKVIEQKLNDNKKKTNSFSCQIHYPSNDKFTHQNELLQVKTQLLQNQIQQIKKILFYNPSMKKYMHKQLTQIQNVHKKFQQLFSIYVSTTYTPLLKLKCSIQQAISNLVVYNKVEKIDLSVKQLNGFITLIDYKRLGEGIRRHNNILTKITLRLCDMQFNQEKCEILKKQLKDCKYLKDVIIQNYYKQCKLGNFQDFNWHPFKKETHVVGKVW